MYARVNTTQAAPERADESLRYIEEKVRPAMLAQGALGLDGLIDRQGGRGYVISWWKDAETARVSEATANQVREQSRQDLGVQILDVHTYEVTLEEDVKGSTPRAARVTPAQGDVSRVDELNRWTESQLLPMYRAQSGFCGWRTLTDRQTGKSLIMSLWETPEAMSAAEALLGQSRTRATQEIGMQFEPTERYEVGAHQIPPSSAQQYEARP